MILLLISSVGTVQGFAYLGSIINSNGNHSKEPSRRLRLQRAALEELGEITKSKDMSLETKAKTTHMLVLPGTIHGCESWTVKKADKKNWTPLKWTARKGNKCALQ